LGYTNKLNRLIHSRCAEIIMNNILKKSETYSMI